MVGRAAQRAQRAARAARRLRGHARQRRHHRVLGRRHVRPHRAAAASTSASASSRPSSRGRAPRRPPHRRARRHRVALRHPPRGQGQPRRRRLLPHPQRDLDRRGHAADAGPRAPTAWCWSTPPRPPAACASTPRQVDAYYFAPQKCLASDGGLWIAAALAGRDRAHRAHRRARPLGPGLPRPEDRARQQPQGPDATTRPPWPRSTWPCRRSQWIIDNGGMPFAAARCDESAETIYDWAEASDYARPYVTDPARAQPRGRHHRPRRRHRRPPRSAASCGPTASSTPRATASWAATSCASPCSPPSTRSTWRR